MTVITLKHCSIVHVNEFFGKSILYHGYVTENIWKNPSHCTFPATMLKYRIMIRLIFFLFGAVVIAIISAVALPLYRIIHKRNEKKGDLFALHFVQKSFAFGCWLCGVTCIYKGLEYLPEDGDPVVFMSNHRSLFDAILFYRVMKGRTGNLAKIELKKTPIIGWWIEAVYGVLLDRHNRRQGMQCVLKCIELLKKGISVLAFPEGTRGHVEGELLMFHKGTFKIATKSGARIIPVAVSGTGDIFDDHRPYIKSHRAVMEFCPPVYPEQLSPEDQENIHDYVKNIIQERLNANASLVR